MSGSRSLGSPARRFWRDGVRACRRNHEGSESAGAGECSDALASPLACLGTTMHSIVTQARPDKDCEGFFHRFRIAESFQGLNLRYV